MNIGKIFFAIIVLIAGATVIVYFMGQFPQTHPYYTEITGFLSTAKDKILSFLTNPMAAIGSAVTAIGAITGIAALWSKLSSAKTQITQVTSAANDAKTQFTAEKEQLTNQAKATAESYEAQITDYKKQLEASTVDTTEVAKIKAAAEAQVQSVQNMHNNFVAQLTSGAQTVIDPATNQTYKLITLEKTVVK